ncbi:hypothetical protein B0H14DRAFT_2578857 [Mycena olivaceomarginata]|nr:hypothetical protein B0H14DRAFT_2578857 [Mycena olivaceomarginata]
MGPAKIFGHLNEIVCTSVAVPGDLTSLKDLLKVTEIFGQAPVLALFSELPRLQRGVGITAKNVTFVTVTLGVDSFQDSNKEDDPDSHLFDFSALERIPERDQDLIQWSPSPKQKSMEQKEDSPTKPEFRLTKKPAALGNSSKANTLPSGPSSSTSSAAKSRGKRSHADVFAAETQKQNEILQALGKDKHERRMAELAVKRQRLEIDIQRDHLAAEERRLAAEDRRREAEYKREREREQHQLVMMRMQLAMQNGKWEFVWWDGKEFGSSGRDWDDGYVQCIRRGRGRWVTFFFQVIRMTCKKNAPMQTIPKFPTKLER